MRKYLEKMLEILRGINSDEIYPSCEDEIKKVEEFLKTIDKFPKALYNIVILKPIEAEQEESSFIMPDEKTKRAIVVSKGKYAEDLEVGDTVFYVGGGCEEFDFEGETYLITVANSDNIKAVL